MIQRIRHRGPDNWGVYIDDLVSIGNCRLKIIDLSEKGNQPMPNEDSSIWITYNGEIYNARPLRKELERLGHTFLSDADTEVIVHGYEEWGLDVVKRLNGMWAFAIYDSNKKLLLLSRDRMGIKPLYYLLEGNVFAFSSELKVFAIEEALRRPISEEGLLEKLVFGFNPSHRTILDSVYKLRPSEILIYHLDSRKIQRYEFWNNYREKRGTLDLRYLLHLIDEAIRLHLIADVPVGCYVSGGLDSSIVAIKYAENYEGKLHTFTVGFEEENDEREYGRILSSLIGAEHHELILGGEMVAREFNTLLYYFDLSITDPAFIPNYFISRLARKYVKVVLAGEGGDEVFGGYDYYRYLYFAKRTGFIPFICRIIPISFISFINNDRLVKAFFAIKNEGNLDHFLLGYLATLPPTKLMKLLKIKSASLLINESTIPPNIEYILELDQRILLAENYNYKADKSTSAASLEERVPLQEYHLVEYLNSLPMSDKISLREGKKPLRAILRHFSPELAKRKKHGYGTPIRTWLRSSLSTHLETAVQQSKSIPFIKQSDLKKVYQKFKNGSATRNETAFLWNLLIILGGLERYGYLC
jgi:asparagine synthase (glutamine-hydrolysing)